MNNRSVLFLIISCLIGAVLVIKAAQDSNLSQVQPRELTTQNYSDEPQRIVSLAPNLTEILFELGLGDKIVAVSSDSDYPAEAAEITKVGSFWQPNIEAIIASRPDLVITLSFEQQKAAADTLQRLGYLTLTLKIETIEELWLAIEQIGAATARRQRADELVEDLRGRLGNLQSKFTSTRKVRILWVIQPEPLRLAGRGTFINELLELAGGENAVGPTIQPYPSVATEELLTCGAEVIIQSAMSDDNIESQQRTAELFWNKYPTLPAMRDGRIYVVDSDTVLRLSPRLPEAVELIAGCLHEGVQ